MRSSLSVLQTVYELTSNVPGLIHAHTPPDYELRTDTYRVSLKPRGHDVVRPSCTWFPLGRLAVRQGWACWGRAGWEGAEWGEGWMAEGRVGGGRVGEGLDGGGQGGRGEGTCLRPRVRGRGPDRGETLAQHNPRPPTILPRMQVLSDLDAADMTQLLTAVLTGLAGLHEAGYVHRDVRWPNILRVDGDDMVRPLQGCYTQEAGVEVDLMLTRLTPLNLDPHVVTLCSSQWPLVPRPPPPKWPNHQSDADPPSSRPPPALSQPWSYSWHISCAPAGFDLPPVLARPVCRAFACLTWRTRHCRAHRSTGWSL